MQRSMADAILNQMMRIFERLWRLLPDKCEISGCCRKGVRGKENRVDGYIMCDYCHWDYMDSFPDPGGKSYR